MRDHEGHGPTGDSFGPWFDSVVGRDIDPILPPAQAMIVTGGQTCDTCARSQGVDIGTAATARADTSERILELSSGI